MCGAYSAISHLCKLGLSLHTCEQDAKIMPTSEVVVGDLMPTRRGLRSVLHSPRGGMREGLQLASPWGIGRGLGGESQAGRTKLGFQTR